MKTSGSMFSGGALFDVGAQDAGLNPIWGIEKDDKIASVARLNGFPVITGDVITFDFSQLERPDHLHASPPCPNFSVAKTGAKETELDIAMAGAICRALEHFKPETFTLEQVVGYRNSQSFKSIAKKLSDLGYWWDATNLNAADFGVPQTRSRLWVRASRGLLHGYPHPEPWKGWYQAIEDLIPSLPDSEFAPWQLARLPEEYKEFMIGNGTYSAPKPPEEPADTITANPNQNHLRAFLFDNGNMSRNGSFFSGENDPAHTIISQQDRTPLRAFVMQVQGESGKGYREEDEPMQTCAANHSAGKYRAFIVGDQKGQTADSERPAFTVRAGETGGTPPRAFVLDGQSNEGDRMTVRHSEDPIFTVSASGEKRPTRAYVGRVVKLDIRCLGRFQTVPDWYQGLTVKINGNGVPCLEAKKILETLSWNE